MPTVSIGCLIVELLLQLSSSIAGVFVKLLAKLDKALESSDVISKIEPVEAAQDDKSEVNSSMWGVFASGRF